MARTLHLLICISAAMTASAMRYKYPYNFEPWQTPYNSGNSDTIDYPSPDRINGRSVALSNEEIIDSSIMRHGVEDSGDQVPRSYKIMNRAPKPIAITRRKAGSADDRILFPGPATRNEARTKNGLPEECQKHKLCENVPDYPVEDADRLIARLGDKIKYLAMDELDEPDLPEITQRVSTNDDNLELCESQTTLYNPKGGLDKENVYHIILNNEKNPIQRVRVEICANTEKPCKHFVCFARNYEARCVQKYVYRPMLTIDNTTKEVVERQLAVPSCCACVAKTTLT